MGRGGKRQGTPGASYANRSDLRTTQPITTVPGQPYGEATAQQDQQRAIPLQNGSGVSVAPGAQAPGTTPPPPVPGQMGGSLFDPTQNPGEPVTHGAASGPGAGPEAMPAAPGEATDITQQLAPYIPAFEALASLPTASIATRNFARRLRGAS